MNKLSRRTFYLMGFLLTALLLGITFYLQNFEGFIPCPLCILQRIAIAMLGVIFFFGSVLNPKKWSNLFLSALASLFALLGILLSGRQVWLQHFSLDKNADCSASLQYLMQALPFDQAVVKIMHGSAECAQKGWEFLHLSLADWSFICFIGFFVFCVWLMRR